MPQGALHGAGFAGGEGAGVVEELAAADFEEVVELGDPVAHGHGAALEGLELGVLDVEGDDAVEDLELVCGEVVFGDGDVVFADDAAGAGGLQAHVGLGGIGPLGDDFGGGVVVGGPVHLVLHGGEELLREVGVGAVVHTGGVDVEGWLPLLRQYECLLV